MPIKELPIFGQFNVQQFRQVVPEDLANWTLMQNNQSKKGYAFYPAMGRRHVSVLNQNILNFNEEPRAIYKSANYMYVFDGQNVYRYNKGFNRILLNVPNFTTQSSDIYFTYLVVPGYTLAVFTDGVSMWVHNEDTDDTVRVVDSNLIANPTALIAFGNRIVVTGRDTSEMRLSKINLGALSGDNIDPATCFSDSLGSAIFAYESENIVNFAVLHNTLYIFLQSTTSVWSNIPSVFNSTAGAVVTFPWKKNTTYNFDYGLASPFAMSAEFGRLVWLGQNQDGLTQVVASNGDQPKPISTKSVDILLGRNALTEEISPFLSTDTEGFLYQYQNTVYFRLSAGTFFDYGILNIDSAATSLEYNFDTGTWHRLIESNGERNRIQQHVYFSNRHLVTVKGENTIYEMSGQFFTNEIRNTDAEIQASNAFTKLPFRYERVTPIVAEPDYGEFLTDWVQIDFVWGDRTFMRSDKPFTNAVYVSDEAGALLVTEDGTFIVTEDSDYPVINEAAYNNWFNPTVELFYSDDGGISFRSADVREFSPLGAYSWRIRWYQLGESRNRVYKLVCVSAAPIVVLGAIMNVRRASGGAA